MEILFLGGVVAVLLYSLGFGGRLLQTAKAWTNKAITAAEDPITMLEQSIEDMRSTIPKLNEGVARAQASKILLTAEVKSLTQRKALLNQKLRLAAESGKDKLGLELAIQFETVSNSLVKTEEALSGSVKALEQMEQLRETQIYRIKEQVGEIRESIDNARTAKLKADLAETLDTYKQYDQAYSTDAAIQKLNEQAALDEGKFMASVVDNPISQEAELEQEAKRESAKVFYDSIKSQLKTKNGKK